MESMYQRVLYVIFFLKSIFSKIVQKLSPCCVHNKFWFAVLCEIFMLVEGLKGAAPFPVQLLRYKGC